MKILLILCAVSASISKQLKEMDASGPFTTQFSSDDLRCNIYFHRTNSNELLEAQLELYLKNTPGESVEEIVSNLVRQFNR